jgi:hypothetical protein
MLYLISILLATGVAVALAAIARKRMSIPCRKGIAWIAVAVAIAGAVLVVFACQKIDEVRIIRSWPTTQATVIDSHITQDRVYNPDIRYAYVVHGVTFEGETKLGAPGFGGKRKRYDVALEVTVEHPVGSHLAVHYDPDNPSVSTPLTHVSWATYTKLSFGVLMLGSGIFLGTLRFLAGFRRSQAKNET